MVHQLNWNKSLQCSAMYRNNTETVGSFLDLYLVMYKDTQYILLIKIAITKTKRRLFKYVIEVYNIKRPEKM